MEIKKESKDKMEERLERELKEYLEISKKQRILPGETRLNVSINNKHTFPYMQLDFMRDMLEDDAKNYTIYFVMACPRKEIVGTYLTNKYYIDVEYKECNKIKTETLTINLKNMLGVNKYVWEIFVSFLEFKTCKSGTTFKVYISSDNMNRMKKEAFFYMMKCHKFVKRLIVSH